MMLQLLLKERKTEFLSLLEGTVIQSKLGRIRRFFHGTVASGPPSLAGGLQWGREGMKYLGVYLSTKEYQEKNKEGILGKVSGKLS